MDTEATDPLVLIYTVNFLLFTGLMGLAAYLTTRRWVRYRIRELEPPRLLVRDVIARLSLAIPFGAMAALNLAEMFGVNTAEIRRSPWWGVTLSSIALFGAIVYVYYELFVIERTETERADAEALETEYDPYEKPFGDL